ncbi:MAG: MurT ligase domain-containing protein [Dehalococcoidia bacterium]|nr:MurT ligase domain-containing protein [Dehalococcoidia bacterium]
MNPRLALAVIAGRTAALVSRRLGRGGGTALPGLVAERVHPGLVRDLARQLGAGRVMITGTNGKTTTARILAQILEEAERPYVHNREGSNLMRGLASTLLAIAGRAGNIPGARQMTGLFEVDEATTPAASAAIAPNAIAFTNLFRDQLDRYGEVDTVAGFWRDALARAPKSATLVINADDPSVAELAVGWPGPIHWFGLDDPAFATDHPGAVDARWCRECGGTFEYERRYFAHIGHWRCTGCGRARARTDTTIRDVRLGLDDATFTVDGLGEVTMPLTGAYNVYNAAAAVGLARMLGVPGEAIRKGIAGVRAAFGRQEVADLEGRKVRLLLTKNPAGANQVLRLLAAVAEQPEVGKLKVAVLLNDRFADGQDVSWTWDVDYELLRGSVHTCWAGGDRAEDMALRLKYAGWPAPGAVVQNPSTLLDGILAETEPGDQVFVIPTYTAMLDLRAELQRRGAVGQFWERDE